MSSHVTLIECPRDAWQGLPQQIPAEEKVTHHKALIAAGFRHIDAVSFVSPKHVPQMADSEAVMQALSRDEAFQQAAPEIIGIVVNEKGLERALATESVTTVGYPHSLSATFLQKNQNSAPEQSRALVITMEEATDLASRDFVVYLSMAFGNPYGDPWSPEQVAEEVRWLKWQGVTTVSLADTVGKATAETIGSLFGAVRAAAPGIELGVHLHSRPDDATEKILAAYEAGCRRFDCALTGLGGCPFAGDDLIGNLPTEIVVETLAKSAANTGLTTDSLAPALELTQQIRSRYSR